MADIDGGSGTDTGSNADVDESSDRFVLAPHLERLASLEIDGREIEAAIAGGLAGGLQAALVIQLYDTDAIRRVGGVVGTPTLDGGWLAMFGLGVAFAVPFPAVVSRSIDAFVSTLLTLSSRDETLRTLLGPLFRRSALATTMVGLGTCYAIGAGVLVSLLLLPVWLPVVSGAPATVLTVAVAGFVGVVAWVVYGGVLGLVYGLCLEN